jgi:hypothetical protein
MTYLPADVAGRLFYLYLILDIFSCKIVRFEALDTDDSAHATHLVKRTELVEDLYTLQAKPVLPETISASGASAGQQAMLAGCLATDTSVLRLTRPDCRVARPAARLNPPPGRLATLREDESKDVAAIVDIAGMRL